MYLRSYPQYSLLTHAFSPSPDSVFTVHATIHIIDSDGMGAPFWGRSNFDFWQRLSQ
jgi:hypothetical protein